MDKIEAYLQQRIDENRLRALKPASVRHGGRIEVNGREYWDLSSNDYLGLADHPLICEAAAKALGQYGFGASASRLLSGDLELHHELERRTADLKQKSAALVFNSGYQANVSLISALCGKNDVVIADKLCHASLIDGMILSGAKLHRYRHNDVDHLAELLKKTHSTLANRLVVTESVFSMDGDIAPLKEIVSLKNDHDFMLYVDEAHATGIYGNNGGGMVTSFGIADAVDIVMGTYGKALGGFGAYVACSQKLRDFFINACRGFIYSTSLPACVIAANIAALDLLAVEPHRRKILIENAKYSRELFGKMDLTVLGSSQILSVIIDANRLDSCAASLRDNGFWVLPIKPPTVPPGTQRLRFSLTYNHSREVLDKIANSLGELLNV